MEKIKELRIKELRATEQAYKKILEVVNKYEDVCCYDFGKMEEQSREHLFGLKLKEEHGFNINPRNIHGVANYIFDDYRSLQMFGEGTNRNISWEDKGRQPGNELMLVMGFSTGAYMFGKDYPQELFKEFFLELKSYDPKYTDSTNKYLYFSLENAGKVFNDFDDILNKFWEKYEADSKRRKILELTTELEQLKGKPC